VRGPHFSETAFGSTGRGAWSEQPDHPFHSPIGQRLPLLDPLLEPRPVRDAFVDCARRTQVYKGRVGATPREGTRISNLSNRGDLRNAGAQMVLLCFAPVKHGERNGLQCCRRSYQVGLLLAASTFRVYCRPTGSYVSLCVFTFDVRGHLADSVLAGKTCTSDISSVISRL
jgi:hypothetical protein